MASYIGKVQIGNEGDQILIGSSLYGVCSNAATDINKTVTLPDFDTFMHGITVQVRFVNGNSVTDNVTLAVGGTNAFSVIGNCVCSPNDIISFTLSQTLDGIYWYANHSIKVEEGSTNGTIEIAGQEVSVHGLGSAAYQNINAFATAAQGQKADDAMPKSGGTFTGPVFMPESTTDQSEALAIATKDYVVSKTAGLSGLQGAMHFRGETSNTDASGNPIVPDSTTSFNNYDSGDVLLVGNQEYVYFKSTTAAASQWILLGDEGSYVLRTSIENGSASKIRTNGWTANTLPSLTLDNSEIGSSQKLVTAVTVTNSNIDAATLTTDTYVIPNVTTPGTPMTAQVSGGILTLTPGNNTQLGTAFTVKSVNTLNAQKMPTVNVSDATVGWNAGTAAQLAYDNIAVLVPVSNP